MARMGNPGSYDDRRSLFVGRWEETLWLSERFRNDRGCIVIVGPPAIGKTALVEHFLASGRASRSEAAWIRGWKPDLEAEVDALLRRDRPPAIVVIDDADGLSDQELDSITSRILNHKPVRQLIIIRRTPPTTTRAEILHVGALSLGAASDYVRALVPYLLPEVHTAAVKVARISPWLFAILAERFRVSGGVDELERLLRGDLYEVARQLIVPEQQIIATVQPQIILANERLMEHLKRQPETMFDLPPRKFEELVADLLVDLGYDVELTPATRDGGKDILAYMETPHGRLLCLVEAKRYRADRKVGVELVRGLYGTLADVDASSAMLVTTSSFSPDALAFQKRHQYKLALRDYGNVVQWIEAYKKKV